MCGYSMSSTGFEIETNPASRARVSRCLGRRCLENILPRRGLPQATDASKAKIVPLLSCNPVKIKTIRQYYSFYLYLFLFFIWFSFINFKILLCDFLFGFIDTYQAYWLVLLHFPVLRGSAKRNDCPIHIQSKRFHSSKHREMSPKNKWGTDEQTSILKPKKIIICILKISSRVVIHLLVSSDLSISSWELGQSSIYGSRIESKKHDQWLSPDEHLKKYKS